MSKENKVVVVDKQTHGKILHLKKQKCQTLTAIVAAAIDFYVNALKKGEIA